MSVPPPHIVPLFATPFGVATLPASESLNAALAPLFAARTTAQWRAGGAGAGGNLFRGRDDLFEWPDEPVQRLARLMLASVLDVAGSIGTLRPEQLESLRAESRAWFSVVRPDGCIPSTSYSNSAWIAVYCVAAPAGTSARADSGVLRLHESRLATSFADATTAEMVDPYRHGHSSWRPVPGQLAIFPGATTHEIALLRATGELVLVTARVRYLGPAQTGVPWW